MNNYLTAVRDTLDNQRNDITIRAAAWHLDYTLYQSKKTFIEFTQR